MDFPHFESMLAQYLTYIHAMDKSNSTNASLICIANIPEDDWRYLRDHSLPSAGWELCKGGGLDYSWGRLSKGTLQIYMEYDIWAEGYLEFNALDQNAILAQLPQDFTQTYATQIQEALSQTNREIPKRSPD